MAKRDYDIDDSGNLVERGTAEMARESEESAEAPEAVTPAARRRFLIALMASDAIGVLVLGGSAALLPDSRTILSICAVAYLVVSVPIYVWMSRSTQRKVEESQRRQLSS
jgi:hypothetical protein